MLGRKHVLLGGLALFLAGAIIAAVAGSTVVLLIGRTVQGVGAAGTISVTVIIVTDLVPLRQRPQWIGLLNGMWAIGSVTGPVIGGAFAAVDWVRLHVSRIICMLYLNRTMVNHTYDADRPIALDFLDQHTTRRHKFHWRSFVSALKHS